MERAAPMDTDKIISEVVQSTQNEFILFFVLIIVALVVFIIPLYGMILKDRKAKLTQEDTRQDKYIEREKQIIEVIKENSAVIAGLKVTLENIGVSTKSALDRVHERIDKQNKELTNLASDVAQMNVKFVTSFDNQKEMAGKINKILLIVDKIINSDESRKGV